MYDISISHSLGPLEDLSELWICIKQCVCMWCLQWDNDTMWYSYKDVFSLTDLCDKCDLCEVCDCCDLCYLYALCDLYVIYVICVIYVKRDKGYVVIDW